MLGTEGSAYCAGETLTEGTGSHIYTGDVHIAAAGHTGAIVIEHEQAFTVEETAPCERGIQTRTRGPLEHIKRSRLLICGFSGSIFLA